MELLLPYVSESVWLGPMNYIQVNGISEEDAYQYDEIRKACRREHLEQIYEALKDFPKIRFKDSMNNKLGHYMNKLD